MTHKTTTKAASALALMRFKFFLWKALKKALERLGHKNPFVLADVALQDTRIRAENEKQLLVRATLERLGEVRKEIHDRAESGVDLAIPKNEEGISEFIKKIKATNTTSSTIFEIFTQLVAATKCSNKPHRLQVSGEYAYMGSQLSTVTDRSVVSLLSDRAWRTITKKKVSHGLIEELITEFTAVMASCGYVSAHDPLLAHEAFKLGVIKPTLEKARLNSAKEGKLPHVTISTSFQTGVPGSPSPHPGIYVVVVAVINGVATTARMSVSYQYAASAVSQAA